jgi:hypothetical protein
MIGGLPTFRNLFANLYAISRVLLQIRNILRHKRAFSL